MTGQERWSVGLVQGSSELGLTEQEMEQIDDETYQLVSNQVMDEFKRAGIEERAFTFNGVNALSLSNGKDGIKEEIIMVIHFSNYYNQQKGK